MTKCEYLVTVVNSFKRVIYFKYTLKVFKETEKNNYHLLGLFSCFAILGKF